MKARFYTSHWSKQKIVCIASGPSLTEEDCLLVRASGLVTFVTNTTFRLCPWADLLFAYDNKWWVEYHEEVVKNFKGELLTTSSTGFNNKVPTLHGTGFDSYGNSGTAIISLAIENQASEIILLGYDCKFNGDKKHWHGNHPESFKNCASIDRWPLQFNNLAVAAKRRNIPIFNCSRDTALSCFKKKKLEDAIQIY